jgi:hypothetical protein
MDLGRHGTKLRYGVFATGELWKLCCDAQVLGRFRSQNAALSAGRRAACQAMGSGFDAELHFVDVGGELRRADPSTFGH